MIKYKVFQKLLFMFGALFVPTAILFYYANHTSKELVTHTLVNSSSRQMEYTLDQIEQTLRHLEKQALVLTNDSSVRSYANYSNSDDLLDHLFIRNIIEEKLDIQAQADPLIGDLTVYWPQLEERISAAGAGKSMASKEELMMKPKNRWYAEFINDQVFFHLLLSNSPFMEKDLTNATVMVEVTISNRYIASVLEGLNKTGNGTSFFYFRNGNITSTEAIDSNVRAHLMQTPLLRNDISTDVTNHASVKIDGTEYLIQIMRSPTLDCSLVSYIRSDAFLLPLHKVNVLINVSLLFLVVFGIGFSYMFYKHFRTPFAYLVRKIEKLGEGDYTIRATLKTRTEFDYLFDRFNEMAARTQSLIENVYEEKVRTREAEYKHLQSQINPHFLYNCLFFIVSMANKSPEAVISMAKNLAAFYRYITRRAGEQTTLEDEIRLMQSYLEVQALRNRRLSYTIAIPEEILRLSMPTLLLQPIVENAIVHGIEQKQKSGKVSITGAVLADRYQLCIDDDGAGLSNEEIILLTERIQSSYQPSEEMGCGLRNVNHRLIHRFGPRSGLLFERNEWQGLRVRFQIPFSHLS
ncbi:cache domain-containing sensor histidine kinase [Paenibacillus roseipurpureus]|uniref:Histidine kinase n=1 Tax=Paenibacillus roseopurpureus TaxID=2918901 RepID=A0AA96RH36_9BACL|nr:histidine kinase [Paenibacillus sp. MBLB1832]WNR42888.1 histidine kinase [Paenibacillus sp. MBLB1832]